MSVVDYISVDLARIRRRRGWGGAYSHFVLFLVRALSRLLSLSSLLILFAFKIPGCEGREQYYVRSDVMIVSLSLSLSGTVAFRLIETGR